MSDFSDIYFSVKIHPEKQSFFAKLLQKKSLENVQNVQYF